MAVRLHLKIGLVSEQDRLDSSTDSTLVTEPSIGSVSRSKGSLYIVVVCRQAHGGRPREATALVADTIRREYYYDESAGIPHCLEKSIRSANRRLHHGREGSGLQSGQIGVVVAVVRGHELYVATTGDAEAYLVRQARLLTLPDEERGEGLPTEGEPQVDVWRGDIAVGDTLLLVSANLTGVVGTDELKNAVVTLHPQSAVEHLHHLFVAGGGAGSDGLLAVEATEVAATRSDRKLVPVRAAEPLAGLPDRSPIPLADPLVGAASAVQDRAREVRTAAGGAMLGLVDAVTDLLPRRGARYRHITPLSDRRQTQRRAAMALLSFLGVVLLLGVSIWFLGGTLGDRGERLDIVNEGETALATAQQRLDQVFGDTDLVENDADRALRLLREAWAALTTAEQAGVPSGRLRPLRLRVAEGLDRLYAVSHNDARTIYLFNERVSPDAQMGELVKGPDGAAYVMDATTGSLFRVDPETRAVARVARQGDGPSGGMTEPWMLASGGPDLLVVDRSGGLWRWRPSNAEGGGTIGRVRVGGETAWGRDLIDVGTYVTNLDDGLYNLYVLDPSSRQILRYLPAADGSGFPAPNGYLATETDVSRYRQMYIDGDIYVVEAEGVTRFENGRTARFELEVPPDAEDIRPGRDYRLITGTGPRGEGRLYIWDAAHERILVFDKSDGAYLEQFIPNPPSAPFSDVRGMYIVERPGEQPPLLYWLIENRLFLSVLEDVSAGQATPAPSGSPGSSPTPSGGSPGASAAPSLTTTPAEASPAGSAPAP